MALTHEDPPYSENLVDGRIAVAEIYKQVFDSGRERDDWKLHRTIREPGAQKAKKALHDDTSLFVSAYNHDSEDFRKALLHFHRLDTPIPRPCIFFVHGGLMTGSDAYVGVDNMLLEWGKDLLSDAVVISVEYERPPQSGNIKPSADCWETFLAVWRSRTSQNIDPDRVVVYGASAGGCLAASMILRWTVAHRKNPELGVDPLFTEFTDIEDPPFPNLKGVYLEAPMLDDRHLTISRRQYAKGDDMVGGNLTSAHLGYAWGWLLNTHEAVEEAKPLNVISKRVGADEVSVLEAPGRATAAQLQGFPPVCVEVGDADPLRDEGKEFIDRIRASGGENEAEYKLCQGGVPHGGWAIDSDKKEKATRDLLSARVEKLRVWLS